MKMICRFLIVSLMFLSFQSTAGMIGTDKIVSLRMEAAHLRGCLAHDDAGHQRHAGHVATGPELMIRDILVADADSAFDVVEDNRRELLHFEALGIVATDFFDVRDHVIEVIFGEIDDQILALHRTLAEAFAGY